MADGTVVDKRFDSARPQRVNDGDRPRPRISNRQIDDPTRAVVLPNRGRPSPRLGELGGSVQREPKDLLCRRFRVRHLARVVLRFALEGHLSNRQIPESELHLTLAESAGAPVLIANFSRFAIRENRDYLSLTSACAICAFIDLAVLKRLSCCFICVHLCSSVVPMPHDPATVAFLSAHGEPKRLISNRRCCRLELAATTSKQTTARVSNRRKSASFSFLQNSLQVPLENAFLIDRACQLETDVTPCKQTAAPLFNRRWIAIFAFPSRARCFPKWIRAKWSAHYFSQSRVKRGSR